MIEEIVDEFDFEKVHRVMLALNWQWHHTKGVPEIADLRRTARSLLKQVVESKDTLSVGTGGFTAYMHHGLLGLRFEISSYEIEVASFEKGIGQ